MIKLSEIYKCSICGNIVQVIRADQGELVCCGKPMELLMEKTKDRGKEKHVPVVQQVINGIKVKVGSIPHPMEEEHHIEWIEVISNAKNYRKFLKPGEVAEAEFNIDTQDLIVREYCNLHGLWKG